MIMLKRRSCRKFSYFCGLASSYNPNRKAGSYSIDTIKTGNAGNMYGSISRFDIFYVSRVFYYVTEKNSDKYFPSFIVSQYVEEKFPKTKYFDEKS